MQDPDVAPIGDALDEVLVAPGTGQRTNSLELLIVHFPGHVSSPGMRSHFGVPLSSSRKRDSASIQRRRSAVVRSSRAVIFMSGVLASSQRTTVSSPAGARY